MIMAINAITFLSFCVYFNCADSSPIQYPVSYGEAIPNRLPLLADFSDFFSGNDGLDESISGVGTRPQDQSAIGR